MINVYELGQEDAYQALVQINTEGEIAYNDSIAIKSTALCGKSFGSEYIPVKLTWGTTKSKKTSDIQAMLSPFIIFSEKALEVLAPMLEGAGQILDIDSPVENMKAFHVTKIIEHAVDLDASKYKIYPQATVFSRVVLLGSKIKNVNIFRLKESPATVFVSEKFKDLVIKSKLKGFDFISKKVSQD